jgi:acyl-CoA synthetase (AMP-forming)/AMP-acid ligase II
MAKMMNVTQPLHSAANLTPDALATNMDGRIRTWGELADRVARLAGALQNLGVDEGDRVAILALNSDRFIEYYFAVWWAGAVVVPMNVRWSPAENAYSLTDSGTKVLFTDRAFASIVPEVQKQARGLETLVYMDEDGLPGGMLAYEQLIASTAPAVDVRRAGDELAGIYYTGGTTGFPKGVMLPHRALWYNGLVAARHFYMEPDDCMLHAAPMFHLADGAGSMGMTMAGGAHAFVPSFTPEGVIDAIATGDVTHTLLVPTMIGMVLQSPAFHPDKFRSCRYLIYGASPMPEGLLRQVMEQLPETRLIQGYGQTEMAPLVSTLGPACHSLEGSGSGRLRSAGRVVDGCEVRILDDDEREVPRGEVGEIVARSPGSMLGYWNLPEQTTATLKDGWVHTGDGARIDDDGFVFIVDRLKDMIVTGGENVFSAEVESAISTHAAVAAVAVIGIPSDQWGEAVHAIVVPQEGMSVTEQEIIDHCKPLIANYKWPRSITIRAEPLPLSGAGKVLKRDLRAPHWEGRDRAVN